MGQVIPFRPNVDMSKIRELTHLLSTEFELFMNEKGDSCAMLNLLMDLEDEIGKLLQHRLPGNLKYELILSYKKLRLIGDYVAEEPIQVRD